MYNYNAINYDAYWYKAMYDEFRIQDPESSIRRRSKLIANSAFNYTSSHQRTRLDPIVWARGSGPFLKDVDGNIFLDFASGIYVTNLGHAHPKIAEAVSIEASKLMNCHDYMTEVKAAYLEKLSVRTNNVFENIHLYDNGTTAVEIAIKIARSITGKHEVLSVFSGHHGKTAGSASLGRLTANHGLSRLPGFYLLPHPNPYRPIWMKQDGSLDVDAYISFYELFIKESTTGQIAAFVIEPIQGWGGGIIPPDDFFPKLKKFCKSRDILLIIDEILTGCGRTGEWFCTDYWDISPDITLLGKGLGNGFPMSAVLTDKRYSDAVEKIGPSTTFGGNPMACGAGLATLEVFEDESLLGNSKKIGKYLLSGLTRLMEKYEIIGDVRGKGCLLALEFVKDRKTKEPFNEVLELFFRECLKRGLNPGVPVINLMRVAPPLIVDREMVDTALSIMDESLEIAMDQYC
jgi:4-aminobutyrate aminotransferase-like enzyme